MSTNIIGHAFSVIARLPFRHRFTMQPRICDPDRRWSTSPCHPVLLALLAKLRGQVWIASQGDSRFEKSPFFVANSAASNYLLYPATNVDMEYFDATVFDRFTDIMSLGTPGYDYINTPPLTPINNPTTEDEGSEMVISVSTAFHAEHNVDGVLPDAILCSSDSVFFYVHSHWLLHLSQKWFGSCLATDNHRGVASMARPFPVSESADILNIILHTVYDLDFKRYTPPLHVVLAAVDSSEKYGIPLDQAITPSKPLFEYIMSQAPRQPMDVYICAASHGLHSLAVSVSSYLLSHEISSITDDQANRMGVVYFKKLVLLHNHRVNALKKLLLDPPGEHPSTLDCGFVEQQQLTRAWALATAYLAWEIRPDQSANLIQNTLSSLGSRLSCKACQNKLNLRIQEILTKWITAPRSIE
ncbi:hypothetical protein ABKN59_010251 [Abortiporus biennis]